LGDKVDSLNWCLGKFNDGKNADWKDGKDTGVKKDISNCELRKIKDKKRGAGR
jgi:hypothetical protein